MTRTEIERPSSETGERALARLRRNTECACGCYVLVHVALEGEPAEYRANGESPYQACR